MCQQAWEAYEAQVQLLKDSGVELNHNTPLFQIPYQRSLKRRWEKYQDGHGISPRITLYELRHTFVSMEAGELTDGQLKMLVGHSRNMDTFGVYRHEIKGQPLFDFHCPLHADKKSSGHLDLGSFYLFCSCKKGAAHSFLRGPLIFMHSDEGEIQSACCCAHVGDAEQCTAQRAEVDLG